MGVHLERLVRSADRVVPLVLSAYFLFSSPWLFAIYLDEQDSVFFDWAWPYLFALAGVVTFGYALFPSNLRLFAWSGGLMVGALLSRAFTLVASWIDGTIALSTARMWLSFGTWMALAFAVSVIWILMRPLGEVRRRYKT